MTIFDAAFDVLFADPNLAEDVTLTPSAGDPVTVRAIVSRPDRIEAWGRQRVVLPSLTVEIRASDVTPHETDQVEVRGIAYRIMGAPERRDSAGLAWTCGLIEVTG